MNDLARLIERFERWTGLDLQRGSSYSALDRYLRLRLPGGDPEALARYIDEVTTPQHPEAVRLVNAITVCHSSFYRDAEQLAGITAVLRTETRKAHVWVPACATGEDPYTIALISESVGRPVSILATDINTRALEHATTGIYGPWSVRDLPPSMALTRRADGRYEVPARLRRVITFSRHNLMDLVPSAPEGWDIILCRNVLMYISRERVVEVLQRLGAALRPGGYLFVGANDILEKPPLSLRFVRLGQRHALWRPPDVVGGAAASVPLAGTLLVTPATLGLAGVAAGVTALPNVSTGSVRAPGTPTSPPPNPASAPEITARVPRSLTSPPAVDPMAPIPGLPAATVPPATPPTGIPVVAAGASPTAAPASASAAAPASARVDSATTPARAHQLMHEGKTAEALELVLAVLDADPLCVEARLIAGIAYQIMGDASQATAALRAALVLAPDLWPAEMYLGFALSQLGDEDGARRARRRGAQLAATNGRLPLSPAVATWFEGWRVDAIAMGRQAPRGRTPSG